VGFFGVSGDQNCPLRILLEFLVWGPKKLSWKVLTKNNFFLQITHNGEHIKNSKKNFLKSYFLMGLSSKG